MYSNSSEHNFHSTEDSVNYNFPLKTYVFYFGFCLNLISILVISLSDLRNISSFLYSLSNSISNLLLVYFYHPENSWIDKKLQSE